MRYKPHDFTPIGKIASTPMVIATRPELDVRDMEHLVRLAKERPGAVTIGITGAAMKNADSGLRAMRGITGPRSESAWT